MPDPPTGAVTFLFTDIEGSTQLWERHPEAMRAALARHDAILHEAVELHNGHIVKGRGDGCHAAFERAIDGVMAALTAQRSLSAEAWDGLAPQSLRARMALHTGEAEARAGDYFGPALNRVARLMSAGHGGQVLLSAITADLVRDHLRDGATLLDLGEHRLKDLVRPEHVYQLAAPGLPADFPPLKSLDAFPNNLPIQLTSFIGRERELAEAKTRLTSARLLTLIGPGGTGKTRLSLQLAADVLPAFADGVWLVELAPLADPSLILQTLASVFGVREQRGMSLMEIVINYLRAKHLLLILDNCEHLVEACAQLVDQFLRASPNVKIIASSREALGINGETVYRVPSLSLPDRDQATREALTRCEAAQLFVERAMAANPKFNLTEKNASPIAQICRRLDGIPLALELAAARLTVFAPEQIASRLDDRFKLLTGGSRTALPRQQTLRALIDWSYDMLPEQERALLRRLSVFAGGWTFEAAEAICSDLDVLNLLTQLVHKSLVTVDDEGDEARYRLLETVRQYARDKLLEVGESEQIRDRHLDYFVYLTESAESKLVGDEALRWVMRLETEYDNLRAAIEWGMEKNVEAVLRMAGALPNFWFRRGYEAEGRHWIEEVLERADALPKPEGRAARQQTERIAKVWLSLCFIAFSQGDNKNAIAASRKCADFARQLGDKRALAIVLTYEASARIVTGDMDGVDALVGESLAVARESGDQLGLGMALGMIASRWMWTRQEPDRAKAYAEEGVALVKQSGNRFAYTMMLFAMAMGARYQRRFDDARAQFATLLPMFQDMGDNHRANMIHSELAHMERAEGHYEEAESLYRETIMEWQRLGHRAAVANQFECFAFIAKARDQDERAARLLGAAEALREKINIAMTQMERGEYDREVSDLRAGMNEKAFTSAWAEGRALTMERAIAYASGEPQA